MKIIPFILLAALLVGCGEVDGEKQAKDAINSKRFAYIQDSTGVVFAVCTSQSKADYYVLSVTIVPTDQIDAVKGKINGYREPQFLKEWKERTAR